MDNRPFSSKLTLLQNVFTNFSKQQNVIGLGIYDLPRVTSALAQWLLAYSETPRSVPFFLRQDDLGALYTLLCLNTVIRKEVEAVIGFQLQTSSLSVSESNRIYAWGQYLKMLTEIKGLFGMNTSPFFHFDENPEIPFIICIQ